MLGKCHKCGAPIKKAVTLTRFGLFFSALFVVFVRVGVRVATFIALTVNSRLVVVFVVLPSYLGDIMSCYYVAYR